MGPFELNCTLKVYSLAVDMYIHSVWRGSNSLHEACTIV